MSSTDRLRVSDYVTVIPGPSDQSHRYLVHGYSGAIDAVPKGIAEGLEARDPRPVLRLPAALVDRLRGRGYLTDLDAEQERGLVKGIAYALHEKRLRKVRFEVSPWFECNFECRYCYQQELRASLRSAGCTPRLDAHKSRRVFAAIEAIAPEPEERLPIVLLGGEPLMQPYKPVVGNFLRQGARAGHTFFIVTNGGDFRSMVDILEPEHIDTVQFTLDGPREEHEALRPRRGSKRGSYDDNMWAIRWCLDRGINVSVRVNTESARLNGLTELLCDLDSLGILRHSRLYVYLHALFGSSQLEIDEHAVALARTEPLLGFVDVDAEVERVIRQLLGGDGAGLSPGHCAATARNVVFHPDGRMFACGLDMGTCSHGSPIGTYYPSLRLDCQAIAKWQKRNIQHMAACLSCRVGLLHGGGCACRSSQSGGRGLMAPNCEDFPQRLAVCFPYAAAKWLDKRGSPPLRRGVHAGY